MKGPHIYWFIGQPGTGQTELAKKLQFWLQTDKANWRKSILHIVEAEIKSFYNLENYSDIDNTCYMISKYVQMKGHDIVVSTTSPNRERRDKFKSESKIKEIYCHNTKPKPDLILDYEPPLSFYVDIDTSNIDAAFDMLVKVLV